MSVFEKLLLMKSSSSSINVNPCEMRWGGFRCFKRVLPFAIFGICCIGFVMIKFPKCKEWQPPLMHRPVLFIGGVPRSGTTLIRAMLDAHPEIRCGEETRVIPNILSMLASWEKEGHKRLLDLAGVTRNVLNNAVGAFIGIVVEQHGDNANLLCDKDPLALKMMVRLSEIFPKAKFILMLRDGRASVHSMIVRKVPVSGFDRTNKEQMLSQWNKTIAQMYNSCQFLGPSVCLPVYYEKLILSPKEQMEKILNFLEISFSQNVLEHHKHIGDEIRLSPREFSTSQVKNKINHDALDAWVGFFEDELLSKLEDVAPMLTKLAVKAASRTRTRHHQSTPSKHQMTSAHDAAIIEQNALALPSRGKVKLKMCNLRLHSSGVFSNVYRGTLLEPLPRREIAMKKTWPEKADEHRNIELIILLALSRERHKNIVQVIYTFQTISDRKDKRICESMIFDFMPQTLTTTIKEVFGPPINLLDIKLYTWQLFNGLYFLLRKRICHRDIKPQNLLVEPSTGLLKIGDFGSAKSMTNVHRSTPYQVTRFYRPPELLLDSDQYSCLVDVWSAGCCFGEMLRGEVLFPGREQKHQLKLIMQAIGSPTDADIIALKSPTKLEGEKVLPKGLESLLPKAPPEFVAFLKRILVYAPKSRLHGKEFLLDPFFNELFSAGRKRSNGRLLSDAIVLDDLTDLRNKKTQKSRGPSSIIVSTNNEETLQPVNKTASGEKALSKEKASKEKASQEGDQIRQKRKQRKKITE